MLARHRTITSLIIIIVLALVGAAAIFWARGFKPNFKNGSIDRTGLIVANSQPTGAQVYLDDRLTSATDTNIAFLEPKTYKVRIEKDGFTTWQKDIEVKEDLSVEIEALLFPTAPEIKPLTTTGAVSPSLSPDGSKIAYSTPGVRGGLYVLPMSDRPFPFRQNARLLVKNGVYDYTASQIVWSPDSKQIVVRFPTADAKGFVANLLLDTEKTEQEPRDITASLASTFANWQEELDTRAQTQAVSVPQNIKEATAQATINQKPETKNTKPQSSPNSQLSTLNSQLNYHPTGLVFSPDEEKILYTNRDGNRKIYDLKTKREYTLPAFENFITISWYPDSNHLVVAQNDAISIIEADGANKITVYSGKFENGFVFPHPSATRLIILTPLTQSEGTLPNLYSVNLR